MRLDMSQQMRMLQQMKLAPRMIQSMEILQLPIMALEERIRQEEQQNVTLECGPSPNEKAETDLERPTIDGSLNLADDRNTTLDKGPSDQEFAVYEQIGNEGNENYIPEHRPSRAGSIEMSDKKHDAMLNMEDRPASLEDHLLDQLSFLEAPPEVMSFAQHLVANLNDKGFLNDTFDNLRASYGIPLSEDKALDALELVQSCEPTGVGARDLSECLLLQLDEPDPEIKHVQVLRTLLQHHFDDLLHNRLPVIQRKTGFPMEVIQEAIGELRHLELDPGGAFAGANTQYVVPDITVEQSSSGEFVIKMNESNVPSVRISKQYEELLRDPSTPAETVEYIKKKMESARWLIESIQQRRNTLKKVTQAIIDHQREFLEKGVEYIEPLKMQEIADRVGVHVTTVSRAVDGKWVQTPRGNYPLKRFFGGGTQTADGQDVAWETIKRKLTEIINGEDKHNPYSDDELVKKLAENSYPLARRTVTKYRKMLGIPSSRQRKVHL